MAKSLRARFSTKAFHKARGFTLTELAIVLSVMGIILAGIWVAASQVYENNRTKQSAAQVATIISNWQAAFGSRAMDLTDPDVTYITANNNFAPSDMYDSSSPGTLCQSGGGATAGCALDGPWDSSLVNITPATHNSLFVTYSNLTQQACENFANANMGDAGLLGVAFNGGGQTQFPPVGNAPLLTTADVDAGCANATGNSVQLELSVH